jgi:hypothetical protein
MNELKNIIRIICFLNIFNLNLLHSGIFASGVVKHPRLNPNEVRWVAVRGNISDWVIYYDISTYDNEFVARHGEKMITSSIIRSLVPCTDEAFSNYRY